MAARADRGAADPEAAGGVTYDDLIEQLDELQTMGDTPVRFRDSGEFLEVVEIKATSDGTVVIDLELEA